MALCYHEEYFALGLISAFFIFAIITLFEDVIGKWWEKVKGLII